MSDFRPFKGNHAPEEEVPSSRFRTDSKIPTALSTEKDTNPESKSEVTQRQLAAIKRNCNHVQSIGFRIADGLNGPFALEVDWVSAGMVMEPRGETWEGSKRDSNIDPCT